jgi:hemerythrin
MSLIRWSKKLSIGIESIDCQHRGIIRELNQFHAAMLHGKGANDFGPLLKRLEVNLREHFSAEELLMTQTGYPGLAEQHTLHQDMIRECEEYLFRFEQGDKTLMIPFLRTLYDGFKKHLLVEDKKFASWLLEQGIQQD